MEPLEIFKQEQKNFFKQFNDYIQTNSERDENGEIIDEVIMPHKGFHFSASYNAIESSIIIYNDLKFNELKEFIKHEIIERRDYSASKAFEIVLDKINELS